MAANREQIEGFISAAEAATETFIKYLHNLDEEGKPVSPKYRIPYSGDTDQAWFNLIIALDRVDKGERCDVAQLVWITKLFKDSEPDLEVLQEYWPANLNKDSIAAAICLAELD